MVEVKVPRIVRQYMSKTSKEVKSQDINLRLLHTRECVEMNLSKNNKIKVEKELSREQRAWYNEMLKKDREKYERYMKKVTKNSKKNKPSIIVQGNI